MALQFPKNLTIRELRNSPPTVELNDQKNGPALDPVITGEPDADNVALLKLEIPQTDPQSPLERHTERGLDAAEDLSVDNLKNVSGLVRDSREYNDIRRGTPEQRAATEEGNQAKKSIDTIRNAIPNASVPAPGSSRKPAGPPVQGPRGPKDKPSTSESIREHSKKLTGPQALEAERNMPDSLESAPSPKLPNSGQADQGTPQDLANEKELVGRHNNGNLRKKFESLLENEEWARKTYGESFTDEGFGMFLADQGEVEGGADAGDHLDHEELSQATSEINTAERTPAKVAPKWVDTAQEENRATQSGRPRGMKMDAMSRWMLKQREEGMEGAKGSYQDPDQAFADRLAKHVGDFGLTIEQLEDPSKIKDKELRAKAQAIRATVGAGGGANTEGMDQSTMNELNKGLSHYLGRNTEATKTTHKDDPGGQVVGDDQLKQVEKKYDQNDFNAFVGEHVAATNGGDAVRKERANINGELDTPAQRDGDGLVEREGARYKNVRNPNTGEWELQQTQDKKDELATRRARTMLKEHIKNHPEDFVDENGQLDEAKMRQFMHEHGGLQGTQDFGGDSDGNNLNSVFGTSSERDRNQRQADRSTEFQRQNKLRGQAQLRRGPYNGAAHYNDQISTLMENDDMHSAFALAKEMGDSQTMEYITNFMNNQALVESKQAESAGKAEPTEPTMAEEYRDIVANSPSIMAMAAQMSEKFPDFFAANYDMQSPEGRKAFTQDMASYEINQWQKDHGGERITPEVLTSLTGVREVLKDYGASIAFNDNSWLESAVQFWNSEGGLTPAAIERNQQDFDSFYKTMMDTLGLSKMANVDEEAMRGFMLHNIYWPYLQDNAGERLEELGITDPNQLINGPDVEGEEEAPDVPRSEEPDLNEEDPEAITPKKIPPIGSPGRDWHKKPTLREQAELDAASQAEAESILDRKTRPYGNQIPPVKRAPPGYRGPGM